MKGITLAATLVAVTFATVAEAQREDAWRWNGTLGSDRTVYIHNVNGAVRVEVGSGNAVEVSAVKRWRRGDPDDVRIEARMTQGGAGDVIICALWNERSTCDEDGYRGGTDRGRRSRDGDVSVEFTVRVPAGARIDANTVNGSVRVDRVNGSVRATSVNGDIEAESAGGRVTARTTNGSITASGRVDGGVEYATVNGSISIELPADANADVELSTVNGRIATEFPITFEGAIDPRRIRASIGEGGPTVRARTVNGSIRLRKR